MDEICNTLASTGAGLQQIVAVAVAMIGIGIIIAAIRARNKNIIGIIPALLLLAFSVVGHQNVSAQSANDNCNSTVVTGQTPVDDQEDVPEEPETPVEPTYTITAEGDSIMLGSCNDWVPEDFGGVDLMPFFTTEGTGVLLPETIDLIPDTPERDTSVTSSMPWGSITFTVDDNGIVTMTEPSSGQPGNSAMYGFDFTITDSNNVVSEVGSYLVQYLCF